MGVLGHHESDFQSAFYVFECKKDVPMNCVKLSQTNAKTRCLNPKSGHYAAAKRGNFLSQEEVGGIDGIKTPYTHVKTEISASKSIFHSFHAVLWSMDLTQKMTK